MELFPLQGALVHAYEIMISCLDTIIDLMLACTFRLILLGSIMWNSGSLDVTSG